MDPSFEHLIFKLCPNFCKNTTAKERAKNKRQVLRNIINKDEKISVVLEYFSIPMTVELLSDDDYEEDCPIDVPSTSRCMKSTKKKKKKFPMPTSSIFRRFFRCPARTPLTVFDTLIKGKLNHQDDFTVHFVQNLINKEIPLETTLLSLADSSGWLRKRPLRLMFTVIPSRERPPVLEAEQMPILMAEQDPIRDQSPVRIQEPKDGNYFVTPPDFNIDLFTDSNGHQAPKIRQKLIQTPKSGSSKTKRESEVKDKPPALTPEKTPPPILLPCEPPALVSPEAPPASVGVSQTVATPITSPKYTAPGIVIPATSALMQQIQEACPSVTSKRSPIVLKRVNMDQPPILQAVSPQQHPSPPTLQRISPPAPSNSKGPPVLTRASVGSELTMQGPPVLSPVNPAVISIPTQVPFAQVSNGGHIPIQIPVIPAQTHLQTPISVQSHPHAQVFAHPQILLQSQPHIAGMPQLTSSAIQIHTQAHGQASTPAKIISLPSQFGGQMPVLQRTGGALSINAEDMQRIQHYMMSQQQQQQQHQQNQQHQIHLHLQRQQGQAAAKLQATVSSPNTTHPTKTPETTPKPTTPRNVSSNPATVTMRTAKSKMTKKMKLDMQAPLSTHTLFPVSIVASSPVSTTVTLPTPSVTTSTPTSVRSLPQSANVQESTNQSPNSTQIQVQPKVELKPEIQNTEPPKVLSIVNVKMNSKPMAQSNSPEGKKQQQASTPQQNVPARQPLPPTNMNKSNKEMKSSVYPPFVAIADLTARLPTPNDKKTASFSVAQIPLSVSKAGELYGKYPVISSALGNKTIEKQRSSPQKRVSDIMKLDGPFPKMLKTSESSSPSISNEIQVPPAIVVPPSFRTPSPPSSLSTPSVSRQSLSPPKLSPVLTNQVESSSHPPSTSSMSTLASIINAPDPKPIMDHLSPSPAASAIDIITMAKIKGQPLGRAIKDELFKKVTPISTNPPVMAIANANSYNSF